MELARKIQRRRATCASCWRKSARSCAAPSSATYLPQRALIDTIHAAAEPLPLVSQWVQLPPRDDARLTELSASAIDQYERCPLAYKLSRDWRIPEEPVARMQFGAAMHLAIKAYFDGVRAGRPPDEETVIACFLDEFSKAKIEEAVQRELYEEEGRKQLTQFLHSDLAQPRGEILHTERSFRFVIDGHHGESQDGPPRSDLVTAKS